ncbi:MAG TPA: NAD(P)-binding domain-containing protein, partial [Candidatus Binatia bacterium]|nr:NAD(P)-binding domain-containing protein [Candidatus Binatia bacterium]
LTRNEVNKLLNLRTAKEVLERVYRDQAEGGIDAVPPLRLMNRGIRLVAGRLNFQNRVGVRLSVTGSGAMALVFEIDSGNLLAIMGYPISNLRIGATVGLAFERLVKPGIRKVGLIGSGAIAPWLLQTAVSLRPIEEVKVFSRSPERRQKFAVEMSRKFGIRVVSVNHPEDAIDSAEVILVSTNSPEPALLGKWLSPGVPVMGTGRPNEFDDEVYLKAKLIIVTCKDHELGYYDTKLDKPLLRLADQGKINWKEVTELGQIVSGRVNVNPHSDDIYVLRESQGGYGDVALASWAYEEATRRKLGRTFDFD